MTPKNNRKSLVVLVADQDIEFSVRELLTRHKVLDFRELHHDEYKILRHPAHDSGCLLDSHNYLRPLINQYEHALVIFDRDGCGKEKLSRGRIESIVENQLSSNGWGDRAAVVVLDPELEIWIWADSPHVASVLGWKGKRTDVETWLIEKGYKKKGDAKPNHPKEAVEDVLRIAQKARSASLYKNLAEKVSLKKCMDSAFEKFKNVLMSWFPVNE